jgi:hypothetical protein
VAGSIRRAVARCGYLLVAVSVPALASAGLYCYWLYGDGFWNPPELAGDRAHIDVLAALGPRQFVPELAWELAVLTGFAVASMVAGWLGHKLLATDSAKRIAAAAAWAGVFGVVTAVLAKICIGYPAWRPSSGRWLGPADFARYAQGLEFATLVVLAFAVVTSAAVVVTLAVRLSGVATLARARVGPEHVEAGELPRRSDRPHGSQPDQQAPASTEVWAQNWRLPSGRRAKPCLVGVCVSGGGIRSAAFSLGALQALQEADRLTKAQYLVAVSGGGYAAGAMRLALVSPPDGASGRNAATLADPAAKPGDVFANGSPEFDYVRRHSKYLAEGPRQWLTALWVVLRGSSVHVAVNRGPGGLGARSAI